MKTYWMSFAIRGDKNLGCVITDAPNAEIAHTNVTKAGLNPGGEVMIWEMDLRDQECCEEIKKYGKNRLISKEELLSGGAKSVGDLTPEEAAKIDAMATARVCKQCNEDPAHAASHHN